MASRQRAPDESEAAGKRQRVHELQQGQPDDAARRQQQQQQRRLPVEPALPSGMQQEQPQRQGAAAQNKQQQQQHRFAERKQVKPARVPSQQQQEQQQPKPLPVQPPQKPEQEREFLVAGPVREQALPPPPPPPPPPADPPPRKQRTRVLAPGKKQSYVVDLAPANDGLVTLGAELLERADEFGYYTAPPAWRSMVPLDAQVPFTCNGRHAMFLPCPRLVLYCYRDVNSGQERQNFCSPYMFQRLAGSGHKQWLRSFKVAGAKSMMELLEQRFPGYKP